MNRLRRTTLGLCALALAVGGCTLTLGFDALTAEGSAPPKAPKPDASASSTTTAPGGQPPTPTTLYSFDEDTKNTATDTFGLNTALVWSEAILPKWTDKGKRGGGLDFDKNGGWINAPTLSKAKFPHVATVALWVRLRSYPEGVTAILTGDDDLPGTDATRDNEFTPLGLYLSRDQTTLELASRPVGVDAASVTDDDAITTAAISPGVAAGVWVLVVASWDVKNDSAVLVLREDGKPPLPPTSTRFPPNFEFRNTELDFEALDGVIDEVRYYDHVLTEAEINAID